jgi:hypothetical protein
MKDNWQPIAIALGIFIAGLLTGIWSQRIRGGAPHPPIGIMREFRPGPMSETATFEAPLEPPSAEVGEYEQKLDKLISAYRERMRALLKPEQREAFDRLASGPHFTAGMPPPPMPPLPPGGAARGDVFYVRTAPGGGELRFVGLIIYRPFLDLLSNQLKLDDEQRAALGKVMEERRGDLLKFVDATPPPTVQMRLAPPPSFHWGPE